MNPAKPDTMTMTYEDGRGRRVKRTIKMIADARDFVDMAGFPWIILAANPHLSNSEILRFLPLASRGAQRTPSWVQRKRWMFKEPKDQPNGPEADRDGRASQALKIMRANPKLSCPQLSRLLREQDIMRSREWVRKHRCDDLPATVHPYKK